MVGAQKQNFSQTKIRKEKRAIATNIMNVIHTVQPIGRFLTEDLSQNVDGQKSKGSYEGNVNPLILKKTWVCVEPEKVLTKIFQRLREKMRDQNDPTPNSELGHLSSGSEESSTVAVARLPPIISSSSIVESSIENIRASEPPVQLFADTHPSYEPGFIESKDTLESSVHDEEVNVFLRQFSAQHDHGETLGLRELTLKEWMKQSRPKPGESAAQFRSIQVSEYIR